MNLGRTRVCRVSLLAMVIVTVVFPGWTESLWTPSFSGFITGIPSYDVGDIVRVMIDAESSLQYKSSRVDSERVVLEFSGGQSEGLFSFLPKATASGTVNVSGEESVSLSSAISVRVVERDLSGALRLQGRHSVVLSGAEQSLEIDGWVHPSAIDRDNSVGISNIADLRLTFSALIDSPGDTLRREDLVFASSLQTEGLEDQPEDATASDLAPPAEDTPLAADVSTPESAEVPDSITQPEPTLTIDEEKAEELLLLFINRFLDWVF